MGNVHCGNSTTCTNTPGTYVCACVPGSTSRDCKPFIGITTTTLSTTTARIGMAYSCLSLTGINYKYE